MTNKNKLPLDNMSVDQLVIALNRAEEKSAKLAGRISQIRTILEARRQEQAYQGGYEDGLAVGRLEPPSLQPYMPLVAR